VATAAQLNLSESQFRNALGIIAAVKKRGWSQKAAVISIETALTESGMRMIASANVPESQKYPHELLGWTDDGLGHDHASCGMFQQQTGTRWTTAGFGTDMNQTTMNSPDGWGTPAELMNAETSTTKFLNALANVDWQHMENWAAAQAVQHSGFADGSNYRKADQAAQSIVTALWDHVDSFATNEETDMYLVTDIDPQAETVLLVTGGEVFKLGPGNFAAYKELGIPMKRVSATAYQTLHSRSKELPH
jgi:hypothetical protein